MMANPQYLRAINAPKQAPRRSVSQEHKGTKQYKARVNPEGRTGFPYDLYKTRKINFYAENVDELKNDETLEVINLIGALGAEEAIQYPNQQKMFISEQVVHFTDDPGELADDETVPESIDEGTAPKLLTTKQDEDGDTDNERDSPSNQESSGNLPCELHALSPSLVPRIPLPAANKRPSVISYVLKCPEENYSSRVKEELGYEVSSVLGGFIEEMVHEKWAESRKKGCLLDRSKVEPDIHSLVVDAQVKLVRLIECYCDKTRGKNNVLALKAAAREILGSHHSDIENSSSDDETENSSSEELSSERDDGSSSSDIDDDRTSSGMESWNENSTESDSNDTDSSHSSSDVEKDSMREASIAQIKHTTVSVPKHRGTVDMTSSIVVGSTHDVLSHKQTIISSEQRKDVERTTTSKKRTHSSSSSSTTDDEDSSSTSSGSISRTDREKPLRKRRKLVPPASSRTQYQLRSKTRSQSSSNQ